MKVNIVSSGNASPEEHAIILPVFKDTIQLLLGNEKVEPWMAIVILANTVIACIMQMRDEDQAQMLEYFSETVRMAWRDNKELSALLDQQGVGRPN